MTRKKKTESIFLCFCLFAFSSSNRHEANIKIYDQFFYVTSRDDRKWLSIKGKILVLDFAYLFLINELHSIFKCTNSLFIGHTAMISSYFDNSCWVYFNWKMGIILLKSRNVLNYGSTTFAAAVLREKQLENSCRSLDVSATRHRTKTTNPWFSFTSECVSLELGS